MIDPYETGLREVFDLHYIDPSQQDFLVKVALMRGLGNLRLGQIAKPFGQMLGKVPYKGIGKGLLAGGVAAGGYAGYNYGQNVWNAHKENNFISDNILNNGSLPNSGSTAPGSTSGAPQTDYAGQKLLDQLNGQEVPPMGNPTSTISPTTPSGGSTAFERGVPALDARVNSTHDQSAQLKSTLDNLHSHAGSGDFSSYKNLGNAQSAFSNANVQNQAAIQARQQFEDNNKHLESVYDTKRVNELQRAQSFLGSPTRSEQQTQGMYQADQSPNWYTHAYNTGKNWLQGNTEGNAQGNFDREQKIREINQRLQGLPQDQYYPSR